MPLSLLEVGCEFPFDEFGHFVVSG